MAARKAAGDPVRLGFGLLIGLGCVGGVAALVLSESKGSKATGSNTKAGTVPALAINAGETVAVGYASSIPTVNPYDTGAVDMSHNQPGWDYAPIGVRS